MDDFQKLLDKLRKVEALRDGGATPGERSAAEAAHEKLRERLEELKKQVPDVEYRFTLQNPWSHRLFVALCRHFEIRPYRYKGQRYTTVMIRAPKSFIDDTLWPIFARYDEILETHFQEITTQVIAQVFDQGDDGLDVLPK